MQPLSLFGPACVAVGLTGVTVQHKEVHWALHKVVIAFVTRAMAALHPRPRQSEIVQVCVPGERAGIAPIVVAGSGKDSRDCRTRVAELEQRAGFNRASNRAGSI